jgi:hypothetical protein
MDQTARETLLERLQRLSDIRLKEICVRAGMPAAYQPGAGASSMEWALKLLGWADEEDANRAGLVRALDSTAIDAASLPLQPELRDLRLVFGREEQHTLTVERESRSLEEHIKERFHEGRRVFVVVLPGPEQESHPDFVARFQKFTLRQVCRNLKNNEPITPWQQRSWPSPGGSTRRRFRSLLTDLADLAGADSVSEALDTEAFALALQKELKTWAGRDGHRIIAYPLFRRHRCFADAELIRRWVEFWLALDIRGTATLTVFLCVEAPSLWLSRWMGRSALAIRRARKAFKDHENVLILNHLVSPTKADVKPWVNQHCDRAWAIAHAPKPAPLMPLNYDALGKGAKDAFKGRKSRPFEDIKDELEAALARAHQKFQTWGTGR